MNIDIFENVPKDIVADALEFARNNGWGVYDLRNLVLPSRVTQAYVEGRLKERKVYDTRNDKLA
jgi:hypothetical protein